MVTRNKNFKLIKAGYLFPEIQKRKQEFLTKNPDAELISLGIGDTTEPLTKTVTQGLVNAATRLHNRDDYTGYNPPLGIEKLREKIAQKIYHDRVEPQDVFISDGSKSDIGRLQILFGSGRKIALQEPAYPAYIDTSLLMNSEIIFMPCTPHNEFFPDLNKVNECDLIFFCSPHNPTGTAATKEQLEQLVQFAHDKKAIIIFDVAYRDYIQDSDIPKSIYEIEGAKQVAIEVGSFSKSAGFTGVRLGWSVAPKELQYNDGQSVRNDWSRIISTFFNGASNIVQHGGLAALTNKGSTEIDYLVKYYLDNVKILRDAVSELPNYGGKHSPYLWVEFPGDSSWDVFDDLLSKTHIVTTPGVGFGPSGEGFIRLSAFGHRESIQKAASKISEYIHRSKNSNLV